MIVLPIQPPWASANDHATAIAALRSLPAAGPSTGSPKPGLIAEAPHDLDLHEATIDAEAPAPWVRAVRIAAVLFTLCFWVPIGAYLMW